MAHLEDNVVALASRAGWKRPVREADGAWRFRLEGRLRFAILSPDARLCILRGEVADLPEAGREREEMTAEALRRQAGACRVRASVVAVETPDSGVADVPANGRLILQRSFPLPVEQDRFDAEVGAFLNDLAWWRASCASAPAVPVPAAALLMGGGLGGMGGMGFFPGGRF